MIDKTEDILKIHYRNLVEKYGDAPESSQWSSLETQEKRFSILLEVADISNRKILDYGCGTAALEAYIRKRKIEHFYTGVEIVDDLLRIGKSKFPTCQFLANDEFSRSDEQYEYSFLSGVFNNVIDGIKPDDYWKRIIKEIWRRTSRGMAFNMMSSYVDYFDDDLYYIKPEDVFGFCKRNLSPFIVLRNDYQVKPGIVPFEFTVYVYRK